ncbi:MAG: hypothetical protein H7X95_02125 [Deltaproteobacteria bacterium]|nr:hypothetical protein [Deltaproteobacteria bacterium]
MTTAPRLCAVTAGTLAWILATGAVASATEARRIEVDDESPDDADEKSSADASDPTPRWADHAPAPVDAPGLRNVEPRTRLYIDGSLAQTQDLSALPQIAGSGRNWRLAAGGSLKWRRFQFDLELPASQATIVDLKDANELFKVYEPDRHQTSLSIGDLRIGAQWTNALPVDVMPVVAGFGLRVRVPTHTTLFKFYNEADGSIVTYALPYYFHIEPTLLLGGALGPLSFVMNQGALVLMGPDAQLGDLSIIIPTLYFWDAHYAVACRLIDLLALSVEVNTTMQLSRVEGLDFQKLNNLFATSVVPGIQWHFGPYRVDTIARFGLTPGSEVLGVVAFGGTRSFFLRVSRVFN